ncbi:MAG TPA: DUF1858 domain-containing protein [Clostridiales bacterium]|nr:DUF1858 domain-containing protein [Clostridiales bacterium]
MEGKELDISKSVYELCSAYPELPAVLADLGFKDITKPGMLATAGRFMTLPKGAAMKKIDMEVIKNTLQEAGFKVTGA